MPTDPLIEAFTDAIHEKLEAEEFERLMVGSESKPVGLRESFWDHLALFDLGLYDDESSALADLKAQRALERLQSRHADLWERAVMAGAC